VLNVEYEQEYQHFYVTFSSVLVAFVAMLLGRASALYNTSSSCGHLGDLMWPM